MNAPAVGACRCGQVTFESAQPAIMTSACHCTGCQKMSGSAYSLTALFPSEGFRITRGVPVPGGLHGTTRHEFCPNCLSWLLTRPAGNDAVVGVGSGLLENPQHYAPFMETWTQEKLPWACTGAVVSFEAFPDPQEYPALMARFAQR
ncbi:GFA family protein [Pseudomonas putida]|uniref:GFA family protein n=1 Tax=Pseudomonas putida TaxID=303 RepID=UPI00125ED2C8|nr:GFA family protein [Pseudomonas putida]KAB5625750.1 GFA family protein [Pseudomonas putida]